MAIEASFADDAIPSDVGAVALVKDAACGSRYFTYGAALVILDGTGLDGNGPAIGHGGDTVGYHTLAYYFPEKKVTIAVIVESDKGPTSSFPAGATYLADLYLRVVSPYFGMKPH